MAETTVEFALNNLTEQLRDNIDVIAVIKDEVTCLLSELNHLRAFLIEANRNRRGSEILKHFVQELNRAINKAENSIDNFMIEAKLHKKRGIYKIFDLCYLVKGKRCCSEIRSIMEKLKEIRRDSTYALSMSLQFDDSKSKQTAHQLKRAPIVEEDEVVGFDEEADKIINRLLGGSDDVEFIPIVGMPGLGKTTLANKVFKSRAGYAFDNRIWVYVSQSYTQRDLFLNIISQFTRNTEQYRYVTEEALAEVIREHLLPGKYLIVLDDVWTWEPLDDVKIALPNKMRGSKVLFTTRDDKLGKFCCNEPHHLKFLTDNECWELLQKKVFHKDKCPRDLEELGERIAKKCMGLPLAALVIAGALTGRGKTKSEWEIVHQYVSEHIISSDIMMTKKLVQMSCDSLPVNLKACFLYCGAFPKGSEIPAWKIVRLWIAEGFIRETMQSTVESVAEGYLNELVSKSLLMVTQSTSNGQIKAFRVHDMLHEFCTLEASEENLFKEIKLGVEQSFPRNQVLATFRRLSIDSSVQEFISTNPYGDSIRSFLCFSSRNIVMSPYELETIPKSFPLLRVLDIESILFELETIPKSPFQKQFFQLYHLRYLAISSDSLKILPKFMEDLWNLQTLIISTQQETLNIEADICNMPQLRHLHTNASAKLCPSVLKTRNHRSALQTLSIIEPETFTEYVLFARCQNLKKLGIRGDMAKLVGLFELEYLEKLKLMNLASGGLHLCSENLFPRRLKQLTLSGTWFDWNEIRRVVGYLELLEVFKVKENAFTGDYWELKDYVFPCLKVLWIERSELVNWEASDENFPSLERLILRNLNKLEEIPINFANISHLKMMELVNTTKSTVKSAQNIESLSVCTGFKLTIFPPDTISDCN
ncbi:putative late blight resistance protein homolog R1A-3 [Solanum stenotomum]|uniref:putative late blight resistance protein homolog R1A-3 n=1 Tax=Solanum stenotomum TaxID=172797 RepID=UPI0020D0AD1D|nr:putative late blight resistance protein homolog R1A-3 [Solanum stenotomum]